MNRPLGLLLNWMKQSAMKNCVAVMRVEAGLHVSCKDRNDMAANTVFRLSRYDLVYIYSCNDYK